MTLAVWIALVAGFGFGVLVSAVVLVVAERFTRTAAVEETPRFGSDQGVLIYRGRGDVIE